MTKREIIDMLLDIRNLTDTSSYDVFVLEWNIKDYVDNKLKEINNEF